MKPLSFQDSSENDVTPHLTSSSSTSIGYSTLLCGKDNLLIENGKVIRYSNKIALSNENTLGNGKGKEEVESGFQLNESGIINKSKRSLSTRLSMEAIVLIEDKEEEEEERGALNGRRILDKKDKNGSEVEVFEINEVSPLKSKNSHEV